MSGIRRSPRHPTSGTEKIGGDHTSQTSLDHQKPDLPPYPVFRREVRDLFYLTKEYKCMAGGKKRKDLEYGCIEIVHEIPRFVELPKNKCENVKSFRVVCADCGNEDILISGGCDSPRCFPCHVSWSKKQAHDAALRVMACLDKTAVAIENKYNNDDGGENGSGENEDGSNRDKGDKIDFWHFMLSPPENAGGSCTVRNEGYLDEILQECYKLYRKNKIAGGCVVLHYGPEKGDKRIEKYLPEGKYRPHLHVFGYGKRPQGPWNNDRGDWICKTLNDGKPVERDFKFIRDGLHYRLSHALRRRGKHSLRWFGAWAYNKGIGDRYELVKLGLQNKWIENVKRLGCEVVCKCPKCGGDMIRKTIYDANGGYFVDIKGPPC